MLSKKIDQVNQTVKLFFILTETVIYQSTVFVLMI